MEDIAFKFAEIIVDAFKFHPWVAIAGTVAAFVLMAQPLLRALVAWTPNTVDNRILEFVLRVADILTPHAAKRGAKAVKAPDDEIVEKLIEEYKDPADVPAFVLSTLTEAQQSKLADAYAKTATDE